MESAVEWNPMNSVRTALLYHLSTKFFSKRIRMPFAYQHFLIQTELLFGGHLKSVL
jgi:hypothetical protein